MMSSAVRPAFSAASTDSLKTHHSMEVRARVQDLYHGCETETSQETLELRAKAGLADMKSTAARYCCIVFARG